MVKYLRSIIHTHRLRLTGKEDMIMYVVFVSDATCTFRFSKCHTLVMPFPQKAIVSHALFILEVISLSKYHADVLKCHEIQY